MMSTSANSSSDTESGPTRAHRSASQAPVPNLANRSLVGLDPYLDESYAAT